MASGCVGGRNDRLLYRGGRYEIESSIAIDLQIRPSCAKLSRVFIINAVVVEVE